jgi:hypothetical protein
VLNQLKAFRVIHDAVKSDGYIVVILPSVGYVDYAYTPRVFFDIAGYNDYELVCSWRTNFFRAHDVGQATIPNNLSVQAVLLYWVPNFECSGLNQVRPAAVGPSDSCT